MTKRLTGTNPLAYTGVEAPTPPNSVEARKNPEPNDARGFNIGDMWVNIATNQGWLLTSFTPTGAIWTEIATAAGSGVNNFITDIGTAVGDASNIGIQGGALITTDALTAHTVTVSLDNGLNGQVIIGATAGSPAYANLTSSGGSITITNGPNSINLEADTTGFAENYETNSGTAMPAGGDIEILGTDNIFTSGSSNIVAIGLTNGTNGQLLIGGGSVAQWANLTSTGNTITITNGANSINLEAVGGGTLEFATDSGFALPAADVINFNGSGVITTSGSSNTVVTHLTNGTNGQLLIGGGSNPAWATLTSVGGSVVITNGANSINLEATGTGAGASAFVTNSGTANETAGSINILGANVITTTGTGSTVTIALPNPSTPNGKLLIGGGSNPAWATLTSVGGSVVITNGANSINLEATGTGAGASAFVTNSGTANEVGGSISILGGSNITTSGSGSTVTVATVSSPSFSGTVTAGTGLRATTGGLVVSAGGITNTGGLTSSGTTTLSALGNGVLQSNGSGVITSSNGTNGQVLIGGGTNAQWNNITSTDGSITITNTANHINLAVTAAGGGASKITTFTSSGTWTKAAGTNMVAIMGWHGGGGGASGGTGSANNGGGGGGQGSCFYFTIPASFCGVTEPVVVGSGGTGGATQSNPNSAGNNGNPGTPSSFGLLSTPVLTNGGSAVAVLGYAGGQAGMIFDDNNALFTGGSNGPTGVAISGGTTTSAVIRSQGGGAGSVAAGTDGASMGGSVFNSGNYFRYKVLLGTGGGGGGSTGGAGGNFIGFDGVTVVYPGATPGSAGMDAPTSGGIPMGGLGGGGGSNGQVGGKGGFPGGGGGGGGTGGAAGGNGGDGLVIVIEW